MPRGPLPDFLSAEDASAWLTQEAADLIAAEAQLRQAIGGLLTQMLDRADESNPH